MNNKKVWAIVILAVFSGFIWWMNIEQEIQEVTLLPKEHNSEMLEDTINMGDVQVDGNAFFVEYRMQRDRIRAQEIELLKDIINNPASSSEGKQNAEHNLISLVSKMEQELMLENMIKAKGFEDVVFFFKDGIANVVVKAEELTDAEFFQIAEAAASITEENLENILVIANK